VTIGGWGIPWAWAQRTRVPQTGQTTCWQHRGGQINCPGTGQDGEIQAGVEWPTPPKKQRPNGTVRDKHTAHLSLKNADCFGQFRTWTQALRDANTLASGKYGLADGSVAGDWRLPNVKELLSLIDYGQFDPVLPAGHPFLNVPPFAAGTQETGYWTSTTRMTDALGGVADPFVVRLQEGTTWLFSSPPFMYHVWPVLGVTSGAWQPGRTLRSWRPRRMRW
jgi:hypothetical protein